MPLPLNPIRKLQGKEVLVPSIKHVPIETSEDIFERLEKPKELVLKPRPSFIKIGAFSSLTGSTYMEYGGTKVAATVYPPKEIGNKHKNKNNIALGVVNCHLQFSPVAVHYEGISQNLQRKETCLSMALCKALEPAICLHELPNFELEIKVTVLDDDGCVLSTAINCCGVALIEAGIPTYGIATASTICLYKEITFVNPTKDVETLLTLLTDKEVGDEYGLAVISSLNSMSQVTECYMKGYLTPENFQLLTEYGLKVNNRIHEMIQKVVSDHVRDHFEMEERVQEKYAEAKNKAAKLAASTAKEKDQVDVAEPSCSN